MSEPRVRPCHLLRALAVLLLGACQNDLPRASSIEHMRVLGALTEVEGDAQRSSPGPGETAHITWTVVFPDPDVSPSQLSSLFYVCTAPTQFSGTPVCQEFLDLARAGGGSALASGLSPSAALDCAKAPDYSADYGPFRVVCVSGTPKLDVEIAPDTTAQAKLMRGIICRNGTPRFDDKSRTQMSCAANKSADPAQVEEIAVYGTIPLQYDASTENHNPLLDQDNAAKFYFHDPPLLWEPSGPELSQELNDDACTDPAYADRVMKSDGHQESITLRYDAAAREEHDGVPETLTFSSYTTLGKLSDRFTVFRPDATTPLSRSITWELTDEERSQLDKPRKYVRFYFTLLDGRGGYAVTRRDLCVVR